MAGTWKPVGLTVSVGFQVGVCRTLPVSQEQAWELLTSSDGLKLWLGDAPTLLLEPGHRYTTLDGAAGEIRIVRPLEQLRLTWQRRGWTKPSTVQIRFIAGAPDKTTISFHQEQLTDAEMRAEMKQYWEGVLAAVASRLP